MKILVVQDDGHTPVGFVTNFTITADLKLLPSTIPELPETPDAQDIADALISLGVVTQAEPAP